MRTTVDIDEELLERARHVSRGKTKKAVIEEALAEFVNARRRDALGKMIGTFELDLTLEELRKMRGCE
ncbi:MAG TPA: type II toxin-antitoxin system VapB family antitoxin [Dehalococcoidia bacterium]|nr:type II toxin-antitoxin system VapB family antitoxin [Dehalococcoidia bacterium]